MSRKFIEFKWLNIFIRDVLLVLVVMAVNYFTHFRSWWVGFVSGMLLVYITWQFSDYLSYKRSLTWTSQ